MNKRFLTIITCYVMALPLKLSCQELKNDSCSIKIVYKNCEYKNGLFYDLSFKNAFDTIMISLVSADTIESITGVKPICSTYINRCKFESGLFRCVGIEWPFKFESNGMIPLDMNILFVKHFIDAKYNQIYFIEDLKIYDEFGSFIKGSLILRTKLKKKEIKKLKRKLLLMGN
ncbi:MAG: hypothetical protein V2A54_02440 [Bacteroidota bacterium]